MRVGILTLPLQSNYGGVLQAVALYSHLSELGHEVVLLRKVRGYALPKKMAITLLQRLPCQNYRKIRSGYMAEIIHKGFINQYITSQSRVFRTRSQFNSIVRDLKLDAIVVGSDQVWRREYINEADYDVYFLAGISTPIRRVAYAASFGSNSIEDLPPIEEIRHLIERFDHISIREREAANVFTEIFNGVTCKHTLDPTLLVGREFFERISPLAEEDGEGRDIVTYVLDRHDAANSILKCIAQADISRAQKVVQLGNDRDNTPVSILKWIAHLRRAEFVVTDSYHGMIFAILFERQFIVLINDGRGSERFHSILELLGLKDRVCHDIESSTAHCISEHIDYSAVRERVAQARLESKRFLMEALEVV